MQPPPDGVAAALDPDLAAFIVGDVSISVASCDGRLEPAIVRGLGTRVSADRRLVTVYVARSQGAALLRDVEACARIAVVWSRPTTNRTVQFKGRDARIVPLVPGDVDAVTAHTAGFAAEIAALGYAPELGHRLLACAAEDLVAIAFSPAECFAQTPGPGAGARLQA